MLITSYSILAGTYSRPPTAASCIEMADPIDAVDQFIRFEYGASVQVRFTSSSTADVIPPLRIGDLVVSGYDVSSKQALLSWTAPLDDFGLGKMGNPFE